MRFYVRNPFFRRVALVVFLDWLCLLAAALVAWGITAHSLSAGYLFGGLIGVGAACFLALQATGAYDLTILPNAQRTLMAVLATMGIGLAVAVILHLAVPLESGVDEVLTNTAALYVPLLLAERKLFRKLSHRLEERFLIIGVSDLSHALVDAIRSRRGLGVRVVGILSDDLGERDCGAPLVGRIHDVEKLVRDDRTDWVVVASKSREEHFPSDQLLQLKLQGVRVISGVDLYERITGQLHLRDLRASHLIFSDGFRLSAFQRFGKRTLDIAFASVGLLMSAPVLLLAAAAIKLESRGPILFRQTRLGKDNRPFELLKLRSMTHDAERSTGAVFASRDDPRITRVGRFIRRTRIDELPQFWNVLRGDMSVVGPRPERPEFVEQLSERYPYFRLRSACKPGVTGWAQCRYGYVADFDAFEQKIALDLYYLKHRSLAMDVSIIWTTIRTVFTLGGV